MGENEKPKLRLIRGGAEDPLVHSDNANPHGISRPGYLLPSAGTPRKPVVQGSTQVSKKGRGNAGAARPSSSKETYVESDPTPSKGTIRPKRLNVIKGGKNNDN